MEPEEFLAAQIRQHKQAGKWGRGIFRDVKSLSATSKGQLAEDFIVWLAKQRKMRAEPAPSKRGDYDILCVPGIAPDKIYFNLYPLSQLSGLPLVSTAKGTKTPCKLTCSKDILRPIAKFKRAFAAITAGKA